MTEQEIKEILEFSGFTYKELDTIALKRIWIYPDGGGRYQPPIDMNFLEKYVLPKLKDKYGGILIVLPEGDIKSWECRILNKPSDEATFGHGLTLTEALSRAILEVIRNEVSTMRKE